MQTALLMDPALVDHFFGPEEQVQLQERLGVDPRAATTELPAASALADVELLITGWGAPDLSSGALELLPRLRAIVHTGGGVSCAQEAAGRGIMVSSARQQNALPVAQYTMAMITLAAKDIPWASRTYPAQQRFIDREAEHADTGLDGRSVGIVGASTIGELVIRSLRAQDVHVAAYDPLLTDERAAALGVVRVDDLTSLAARSRILSVHAPDTPSTRGLISAEVLQSLPNGSTFINTARGALVDQQALVAELETGRLRAILDVTEPEVLPPGHPLYFLPNVLLTPHMAGSMGTELRRLGASALREALRVQQGEDILHPVPAQEVSA